MAASRCNLLAVFLLCSYAHSQPQQIVKVESLVDGCFTFSNITLDTTKEPVLATPSIKPATGNSDCLCKSAVMKYSAFQKKNGNTFNLLSGQFSVLGKESVFLPIAVQKQLIFSDTPIHLSLSCSNNQPTHHVDKSQYSKTFSQPFALNITKGLAKFLATDQS